jgi:ATP-dependent DNA helicase 2 subunit 1
MGDFDPTDYGGNDDVDPFGQDPEDPENGPESVPRDALLFVVDCTSRGALEPLKPGGRPAVAEVLASAASVLKTKVITSSDDRVGILLYGVRDMSNPNSFEGIRIIQELGEPNAQRIRQLQQEVERSAEQFDEKYGMQRAVPLSEVFWTCTTIFNLSANPKRFQPRVFLFTGNELPCSSAAEEFAAITRAKDLLDLGVEVEFFPMAPIGSAFSIEKFWGRVLPVETEGEDYLSQAAVKVNELERRVRRRVHRRRCLNRLNFELCPGAEISVGIYVNTIQAKAPSHVFLKRESNKVLKSDVKLLCEATGSILHPDDIQTYIEVAGQRVFLSRAEINEAKYFGEPGLKLLGFKSAFKLESHHRIFHSYFVYPNEREVKGSAALCSTLINIMLERNLMALVRYIPRKSHEPFLAALLPQAESEDISGQAKPPGLNMIRLPFADEIRELHFPANPNVDISEEARNGARDLVQAMRLDLFTPGCVENPVLQKHYAAVQALALEEQQPEATEDMLKLDESALAEKSTVIQAWRSSVEANLGSMAIPAQDGSGADGRRVKQRISVQDINSESMQAMIKTGEVERLTVAQMKDFLVSQGVAISGKRADLLARIRSLY